MLSQKIIEDYCLTLNEDGKVYIQITDDQSATFFPLPSLDLCTLITQDEFEQLLFCEENAVENLILKILNE